jgi:hypothetical protein
MLRNIQHALNGEVFEIKIPYYEIKTKNILFETPTFQVGVFHW